MERRGRSTSSTSTSSPPPPPPPPPPPLAGKAQLLAPAQGGDEEYVTRLAGKIQKQAQELLRLQEELDERREYVALCEHFVVAVDPSQPLPLSPEALASAKARRNRDLAQVNKTSRHTLTTLTRQYEATCKKLADQGTRVEELERELAEAVRGREVAERRISGLQVKLTEAQGRINQWKRAAPHRVKNEDDAAADKERLQELAAERKRLLASLDDEARTTEEQRIYIDVLQSALKARTEELGLDPDQILDAEKAKFDVLASKASIERLEKANAELAERAEMSEEKLRLEKLRHRQTADKLAWLEPGENKSDGPPRVSRIGTGGPGGKEEEQGESNNLSALESVSSDVLKARLTRLKQENDALVDYVRETVEPLKAENQEISDSLETTGAALEEARRREAQLRDEFTTAQSRAETMELRVTEKDVELSAAREEAAKHAHEAETAAREAEAARKRVEALEAEIPRLQAELQRMQEQSAGAEEVHQQLADAKRALRCERRELVGADEKRSEMERELDALRAKLASAEEKMHEVASAAAERESEARLLRESSAELADKLEQAERVARDLRAQQNMAQEEVVPLRTLKRRTAAIESAIAAAWDESGAGHDAEQVGKVLQRLASADSGANVGPSEWGASVIAALDTVLPNLSSLLVSARTQLSRAVSREAHLREDLKATEQRFEVEKRLLHDEIHSLRTRIEAIDEAAALQQQQQQQPLADAGAASRTSADATELARLRARYSNLEGRYFALEERLESQRAAPTHGGGGGSARDLSESALRGVHSKFESARSEQVASLRSDLEKATRLVREHEELAKQTEEQLAETEEQLQSAQNDLDMSRRLCMATLKGIAVRYRNSHPAVRAHFDERPLAGSGVETMEKAVTPLCELLETILEHDTKAADGEVDRLTHTLDEFRREQLSLLETMRSKSQQQQQQQQQQQRRGLPAETRQRNARIDSLNASLHRAQRVMDETRLKLERELDSETQALAREELDAEDDLGYASADGLVSEISASRRGKSQVRARSPATVRVNRDGTIHVSTFEDGRRGRRLSRDEEAEDDDGPPFSQSIAGDLQRAAQRLDQIERIRRQGERPETPLARRYRQKLRVAQEKFRRLNLNSKYL